MNRNRRVIFPLIALIMFGIFFACTSTVSSRPNFIFKPAPKTGVVAKIEGHEITEAQLIKGVENDIFEAETKLHEIKMARVRALTLEILMEKDPRKKGLSNDEFLEKFIAKAKKPSNSDIEGFIKEKNIPKNQINDEVKQRISQYLEMESKKKSVEEWMNSLLVKNPVEVYLPKPARPFFDVKIGDAPFWGQADAKVTIVEYTDLQCPFCAKAHATINELKKKYKGKLKVVIKHFPLPFHENAKTAAEATFCAKDQGNEHMWNMIDQMFENQSTLDMGGLKTLAAKIKMKDADFIQCLETHKYLSKVDLDMNEGRDLGIKSTPAFFINGKLINGAYPIEVFSEIIDEELSK